MSKNRGYAHGITFSIDGNAFTVDGFLAIAMDFPLEVAENESVVMNIRLKLAENESVVMDLSVCAGSHLAIVHENQLNDDVFRLTAGHCGLVSCNNQSIAIDFIRYVC